MAKGQKDKQTPKVAEDGEPGEAGLTGPTSSPSAMQRGEAADAESPKDALEGAAGGVAAGDTDEADGEAAATQLGTERYVIAAFFAAGMLLAYVLGRFIHSVWSTLANKDWFSQTLPALAAVGDDDMSTYGTILGGVIALVVVLRTYRNPEIRTWTEEVASELAKVKWPTKKEVTNATFVVITATTVATLYLALLDRFWAFVTNIVYGDGS